MKTQIYAAPVVKGLTMADVSEILLINEIMQLLVFSILGK